MKAISLWQPWASAIALGVKKIETRGWETSYRGPLLIHAALKWDKALQIFLRECQDEGILPHAVYPRGVLLCAVDLTGIDETEEIRAEIHSTEASLGDYSDGRYGWHLANRRVFAEPIPYRGAQGLFDVPDSVIAKALEAVA